MAITLLNSDKITYIESDYNSDLIGLIKTVPSAKWSADTKRWSISATNKERLTSLLRAKSFFFKEMPFKAPMKIDKDHLSYATSSDFNEDSLGLEGTLLPYQLATMDYSTSKHGRFIIGDEMGLGKTIQAIALLKQYSDDWPVIIIAPASLLYNWRSEILTWIPELTVNDIFIPKNGKQQPTHQITICSYAYANTNMDSIKTYLGVRGILIVDEAHFIKNKDAKRTKAILSIAHQVKRCVLLTGTPMPNRPVELYTLLSAINPLEWPDYWAYAKRYCDLKHTRFGIDATGASNLDELYSKMRESLLLRRLKKDVLPQLPDKQRTTIIFGEVKKNKTKILSEITKAYKQVGNDFTEIKRIVMSADGQSLALAAYKQAIELKINHIIDWVHTKMEDGLEKLVIFAHHKDTITTLNAELGDYSPLTIDGSTKIEERQNIVDSFQQKPEHKIIILSINAASTGLTLTSASTMLMTELPWSPSTALQAEDRIHRIGQKSSATIYYTIASNSIDGSMWSVLNKKSLVASAVLDGGNTDSIQETTSSSDLLSTLIESYLLNK